MFPYFSKVFVTYLYVSLGSFSERNRCLSFLCPAPSCWPEQKPMRQIVKSKARSIFVCWLSKIKKMCPYFMSEPRASVYQTGEHLKFCKTIFFLWERHFWMHIKRQAYFTKTFRGNETGWIICYLKSSTFYRRHRSPFLWQSQNLCWLRFAYVGDLWGAFIV